jgi:DNA processing protein
MSEIPLRDRLIALSLLPFLSPSRVRLVLECFDPLDGIAAASTEFITGLLRLPPEMAEQVKNPLTADVRRRLPLLREQAVTLADPGYPPLLKEIPDPPLALHVRGNPELLHTSGVAIVGSRRASPYALNAAGHLVRQLAASRLTIVSGLARGVDAAAHEAALAAGLPTIAVLGTGIDLTYPRSNARLFRRIADEGLIVTEFPPGTPPMRENFPVRNRLISGLTLGTVIVEASTRSGSLITARLAAEQGREVFAVPGSIFSGSSEGGHRLVQYGAKLVHDANDILDELPDQFRRIERTEEPPPPGEAGALLALLSRDEGVHIDWLSEHSRKPAEALAQPLLQLELEGWIRAMPGARYVRVR